MTKEELKLDAESKLDEWSDPNMGCCEGYCYSEVADFMFRFSEPREERIETLEKENRKLKLLVKAMLYEINQIWDIDEMNQDVVEAAEQIEKEAD